MRRLLIAVVGVLASFPLHAAERSSFVWADQPSASKYAPAAAFAYNAGGGPIAIARPAVGAYRVSFGGLGKVATTATNVQVTRYGRGAGSCGVGSWSSGDDDFNVNVLCFDAAGAAADAQFTVLLTWAPSSGPMVIAPGALPGAGARATPAPEPRRRIRRDGTVVIAMPDGRVVENFPGGNQRTTFPDGSQQMTMRSTGVPVATPPQPPSQDEQRWLDDHALQLLFIISSLVDFDQQLLDDYQAFEGTPPSVYEKISTRRGTITRMVQ